MVLPPAGWHTDPHGRHQLRYWDGTRWTEHVNDSGVAGRDAPDAIPAQSDRGPATSAGAWSQPSRAAPSVYVDTQLKYNFSLRRLYVDEHTLWWGDDSYNLSDVTAMTWWTTRVSATLAYNLEYRIKLWRQGVDKK